MQTSKATLYTLTFAQWRTYAVAAAFAVGNVVLPQLFHLVPKGGMMWLPIYFFTLVAAYKYGWRAGLLTAVASPLVNSWLFGMPAPAVLPAILMKSVVLALVAGYLAARSRRATLGMLTLTVLGYQFIGTLGEWALSGSLAAATQDFRLGIPGMLLQILGGWVVINHMIRK